METKRKNKKWRLEDGERQRVWGIGVRVFTDANYISPFITHGFENPRLFIFPSFRRQFSNQYKNRDLNKPCQFNFLSFKQQFSTQYKNVDLNKPCQFNFPSFRRQFSNQYKNGSFNSVNHQKVLFAKADGR